MVFHNFPRRHARFIGSELDRVYEELFGRDMPGSESVGNLEPLVDIEESDQEFRVFAELPGMEKGDVKITFQNGSLTLSGQKSRVANGDNVKQLRSEREFGSFSRSFTIPTIIEAEKIQAEFKNGVLTVILPKADEVKPQEIKIS